MGTAHTGLTYVGNKLGNKLGKKLYQAKRFEN